MGCCYECDLDAASDGYDSGYLDALLELKIRLEARKGVREEAAGIEAAMEEIEKLRITL